jgi:hypothetical protein
VNRAVVLSDDDVRLVRAFGDVEWCDVEEMNEQMPGAKASGGVNQMEGHA